jgi:phytoene dehydrogenase-like protein
MCFLHHCFDPTMAPPGKSAVEVWYATRYDYWETLARDRAAYEAEKKRIAEATIAELDRRWPGFASQVEVLDVPTPAPPMSATPATGRARRTAGISLRTT